MVEINQDIVNKAEKLSLLKYFIVAGVAFVILLTDILLFINFLLLVIIFVSLLLSLSKWLDNKDRYIGKMTVRRIIIPTVSIFLILPSLLSTIKFFPLIYSLFATYYIILLVAITGFKSISSTLRNYSVKAVYFKSFESIFVAFLLILIYFTMNVIFPKNIFANNFTAGLLPLSFVILITGLFYLGVDSRNRKISLSCSYITINRGIYEFLAFIDGISLQLYQQYLGLIKLFFLLVIFFSILYIIYGTLRTLYNSLEESVEKFSVTNFHKYDKTVGLTSIDIVNNFAKSIENFEKYGIKDKLLINLTAYLLDSGLNPEEIEDKLKPLMAYRVPSSLLIGLYGKNSNVSWEVKKRSEIINRLIKTLKV